MNCEEIYQFCMSLPEAAETFPFDEVNLVFKVRDKMFAVLPLDNPEWVSLKCDPELAVSLREKHDDIRPAFHFNKKHWNMVRVNGEISPALMQRLIKHSYNCVLAKMTRPRRAGLQPLPED